MKRRREIEEQQVDGLEFDIDDRFLAVDDILNERRPCRSWADERKPTVDTALPSSDKVTNNRGRAYRRALPSTLTRDEWYLWRKAFCKCCAYCGDVQVNPVLEHVMPIALGGGTTLYNVVPACGHCNGKKGKMDPFRWLEIIGWDGFLESVAVAARRMNEKT